MLTLRFSRVDGELFAYDGMMYSLELGGIRDLYGNEIK